MHRYLLGLLFATLFAASAFGQADATTLRQLRTDGLLLVALPTRSNKVEALQRALGRPDLDAEGEANLRARLAQVQRDNDTDAELLRLAFAQGYDYSSYRFTYDTVVINLRDGTSDPGPLLDADLVPISEPVTDRFYWVAQLGSQEGRQGLRLRTSRLQPPPGVEDFYRLHTLVSLFRSLTKPRASAALLDAQRMVERLDKALYRTAGVARE